MAFGRCLLLQNGTGYRSRLSQYQTCNDAASSIPLNFSDFRIVLPLLAKFGSVFSGSTFSSGNNAQSIGCVSFPYPNVPIIRSRENKSRISRINCRKHPADRMGSCNRHSGKGRICTFAFASYGTLRSPVLHLPSITAMSYPNLRKRTLFRSGSSHSS